MSDQFEHLAGLMMLTQPGSATARMFGCRALTVGGKAFCIEYGDDLVFKLEGGDHADALGAAGASLFDPSGKARPMKQWVQVPVGSGRHALERFAVSACAHVRSLGDTA